MKKQQSKFLFYSLVGVGFALLSMSFVSSSEDDPLLFDKPVSHSYQCPAQTVTPTVYYHEASIVKTQYSNGLVLAGAAWGQSVTSIVTGTPTTYPAFTTHWVECLVEAGLGCTPCVPIKACVLGCDN